MYSLVRPLLFKLDPERAHNLTFSALGALGAVARGASRAVSPTPAAHLCVEVAGLRLPSPVGLAAGLDKDGDLARLWPCVGFGFVELGTVTAHPQAGNPQPRLFRFPEAQALVNRMGFNNRGSEALAARLTRLRDGGWRPATPFGVNIGKSKITPLDEAVDDYVTSTRRLAGVADYLVINVSSPNTPGLRSLQDPEHLQSIVSGVTAHSEGVPVFVKLSPDLGFDALTEAVEVAEARGAAGIIATNTTLERFGLPDVGAGGLSGRPLHARAREVVEHVCKQTNLPVIGVGGIASVADAQAMLDAGAVAIQVYSALIFQGPGLIGRLVRGLGAGSPRLQAPSP